MKDVKINWQVIVIVIIAAIAWYLAFRILSNKNELKGKLGYVDIDIGPD